MTATHSEPTAPTGPISVAPLGTELIVLDGVLDPATCRALIGHADVDRWLTTTAEITRAANGPHGVPPSRVAESSRPCRIAGLDERPRFAVVDDPVLALRLFYRLAQALPPSREQAELAGLKPLLRCVHYGQGEGTEAHGDPQRETGDGQRSQLSVLVFLNDNFDGGAVEFPSVRRTVEAKLGRALVFPHGMIHRDHVVARGRKFVLETEVFYSPLWRPYTG